MSPQEYANLESVESLHWYYAGKRKIVEHWIDQCGGVDGSSLLDCGAGSGAFAAAMSKRFRVTAMDDHDESLEILKRRLPISSVARGSCTRIPFSDGCFDIVTALDVLEHIPDDQIAAAEMLRVLKPGGQFIATVPAMMSLWSDWDVSLHHQRRYSKESLLNLLKSLPAEIHYCGFNNVVAFPLVWLARKARRLGISRDARAEDFIPPKIVNHFMKLCFVSLGQSRINFPFGVGLTICCKKT
jgi:SAM-dependent methyltransferase